MTASSLRILITNMVLLGRSGTETYVRDLAGALRRRGHQPIVYAPRLGPIAEEVRDAGTPVWQRLADLETPPDVIHGHHNLPTMAALLRFPRAPAAFVCHSGTFWADAPPLFPRIRRYVAVDLSGRDRLVTGHGIPESRVQVIYNAVDLDRFLPRGPLPERPRRALLFSNYANELTHLPAVRDACARTGLALEVIGSGVRNVCEHPEAVLGQFDLVFAKARCALEALAVGTAVVLCDARGSGPFVRSETFDHLRRFNFGQRTLTDPISSATLVERIRQYDAGEATAVSIRARAEAGLDRMASDLLAIYEQLLMDSGAPPDPESLNAEGAAAAEYLGSLEPTLFATFAADDKMLHLEAEVRRLAADLARVRAAPIPIARVLASGLRRLLARVRRALARQEGSGTSRGPSTG
jgi:hypothetical protein